MTQAKQQTRYETDFSLWIEDTVNQLKKREFNQVDWENLIEEIEGLTRKDRRELENHLITLFEHALKRHYVPLSDCYRGWEATISRTQQQLTRILRDSPSLRNYFLAVSDECYQDALKNMCREYNVIFPDICPFSKDVESLLTNKLWDEL